MSFKRKLIPVKDDTSFARDPKTDALLNINKQELEQRKKIRRSQKKQKEEIQGIKDDIVEIKNLLKQILEK